MLPTRETRVRSHRAQWAFRRGDPRGPFMAFTLKWGRSRLFIRGVGPMSDEQRRRLKAWKRAHRRIAADWKARYGDSIPVPVYPIFPDDLVGLSCGARTWQGGSCKQPALLP